MKIGSRWLSSVVAVGSLFLVYPSYGWWDQGHETVAKIAEDMLTPAAKEGVRALLEYPLEAPGSLDLWKKTKTMSTSASWADYIKQPLFKENAKADPYGPPCHYMDVIVYSSEISKVKTDRAEIERRTIEERQKKKALLSCIAEMTQVLMEKKPADDRKAIALRYIIHVIGDLHEPLHTVSIGASRGEEFKHNEGGNLTKIPKVTIPLVAMKQADSVLIKKSTDVRNLHLLWDAGVGAFPQIPFHRLVKPRDLNYIGTQLQSDAITKMAKELGGLVKAVSKEDATEPSLVNWVTEEILVALNYAYENLDLNYPDFPFATDFTDRAQYLKRGRIASRRQMALAGYRLGQILNAVFDPEHAQPSYVDFVTRLASRPVAMNSDQQPGQEGVDGE